MNYSVYTLIPVFYRRDQVFLTNCAEILQNILINDIIIVILIQHINFLEMMICFFSGATYLHLKTHFDEL